MRRIAHSLAATVALAASAFAVPALAQDVTITNATVATGDGSEPIANGTVVVRGGAVVYAGPAAGAPAAAGQAIDAQGGWVTPGLFATLTDIGIVDVFGVSNSNDTTARGSPFSAAIDIAPAVNPAAQNVAISRAGGVTRATVAPEATTSIFAGQGAVIDLGDDRDAVMRPRAFQYVELGEGGARLAGGSRASAHALLRNALREATNYGEDARLTGDTRNARVTTGDDLPLDPRMTGRAERDGDVLLTRFDAAALVPVVTGQQVLYVEVDRAQDILNALDLKREFPNLRMVLVGAAEGWMVADQIAASGVPVITHPLTDLPSSFEQLAATQSNVGRMVDAGVTVGIGRFNDMNHARYAPQQAGNLVGLARVPGATGLTWGEAFAAITSIPAAISGYEGRAGVLAPGAYGDVVIWDGDPLELTSAPLRVWIDGVEQPLDNHQSRLRERYRDLDEDELPKAYDW
ncbi:amidohydrolase family protein [Paraurantiacibacter namhicola]|nr:amidohydrolase family protein [Paraurantiacibacter namhicola]